MFHDKIVRFNHFSASVLCGFCFQLAAAFFRPFTTVNCRKFLNNFYEKASSPWSAFKTVDLGHINLTRKCHSRKLISDSRSSNNSCLPNKWTAAAESEVFEWNMSTSRWNKEKFCCLTLKGICCWLNLPLMSYSICKDLWKGKKKSWGFCSGDLMKLKEKIKRLPKVFSTFLRKKINTLKLKTLNWKLVGFELVKKRHLWKNPDVITCWFVEQLPAIGGTSD